MVMSVLGQRMNFGVLLLLVYRTFWRFRKGYLNGNASILFLFMLWAGEQLRPQVRVNGVLLTIGYRHDSKICLSKLNNI